MKKEVAKLWAVNFHKLSHCVYGPPLLPGTTETSFTPVRQSAPLLGVGVWLKPRIVEAFEKMLAPKLGGSRSVEVGGGPSWGEIEEWV
ncbi:MAG TPA: hypothetical protein VNA27_06945 [Rubrobacteraceae bacterium]|nr:hypothetical protein [Rubrobacteraceae bacterium]